MAVRLLCGGRVDFDPVAKAEQPLRAPPVPDQRVKGREQGLPLDAARPAGVAVDVSGSGPTFHHHWNECIFLDQLLYRRPGRRRIEAEIITQIGLRSDA